MSLRNGARGAGQVERIKSGVTFDPVEGGYEHGVTQLRIAERRQPIAMNENDDSRPDVRPRPKAAQRVPLQQSVQVPEVAGLAAPAAREEVADDEPQDVNRPGGLAVLIDPRSPCVWARGCRVVHCPLFADHLRKAVTTRANTKVCGYLVDHVTGKAVPDHLSGQVETVAKNIAAGREGSKGLRGMLWPEDPRRKPGVVYTVSRTGRPH